MKGIIIAGGFGTRLIPLTYSRPKHLLPVANRPFLEYQVALLRESGVDEIVFATNYFAEKIEAHFGDGTHFGVKMRYALEDQPLGTAGAIRNAANLIPNETVIVLNGDILTDFDVRSLVDFHNARQALATIALRPIKRPHAFGALETAPDGRVLSWHEPSEAEKKAVANNPGLPTGESDYINAGIYILEPSVIAEIETGRPVSIEREVYPNLIKNTARVYGMAPTGFWLDIGHPEQYLAANRAVLAGDVRTSVPFSQFGENVTISPEASVDDLTYIGASVIIESGARVSQSIILDGCSIGGLSDLEGVICDTGVQIMESAVISKGAVIASGSMIMSGSKF